MHVVVIGAGEVGSSIAASLADHHQVVVIDIDADRVDTLTYSHDVLALEGDGTSLVVLEDADVEDADMLIASTDDDETNLVACGTASVLGDAFTIARVRDTTFYETWQRAHGAFGVDFMVCTNLLTAQTIVRIAGLPAARDVDPFAEGKVQMAEFTVATDSPLAGQTVKAADRVDGLTFAAVIDEEDVTVPTGETIIDPGAKVVVIGTPESVSEFADIVAGETGRTRDVVVLGGGPIGREVVKLLVERGVNPTIIERDEGRARQLAESVAGATVLNHDPTDIEFLLREQVDKADLAVVSLGSDERTLLVSLLARQIGTRRTVAVVDTGEYVDLFEAVGVDVAINPRELTAEEITRFTHDKQTENVALIESDRAEVIEIEVDADSVLVDRPIQESVADLPSAIVIGAITRNGEVIAPRGDTIVREHDHVIVFVETPAIEDVLAAI